MEIEKSVALRSIRKFIPAEINFNKWAEIKPWYDNLLSEEIDASNIQSWLLKFSELDSALSEHIGWLYIAMTRDTRDKTAASAYNFFMTEIHPLISEFEDTVNRKLLESGFTDSLPTDYQISIRGINNQVIIFRKENVPLLAELAVKEQQYGEIAGEMTIDFNGKTYTLQQASNFLKDTDRKIREEVYLKITNRRLEDSAKLDKLFDELLALRQKVAQNAGYNNYKEYKFVELNRFDYTDLDCKQFHKSVGEVVTPVIEAIHKNKKQKLGLDKLMPWDLQVDLSGRPEIKPFLSSQEMIEKTFSCFSKIDPAFGDAITMLNSKGHLDLESRIAKAPGGYNYPLYESGIPFIFMNSSNSLRDLVTMVHEGGHAIQSILNHDLAYVGFKELPSEVAELASMGMELISMEHWDYFISNNEELKRAKAEQLEGVLETLPWIAVIDKFQHWIYENPMHSIDQRTSAWLDIYNSLFGSQVCWEQLEQTRAKLWQKQLHLFEVPFYYIEYGIAQLGAIALWKNYRENPGKTIGHYKTALSLGNTKSIPLIYKAAGIQFNFSEEYIHELIQFVFDEYKTVSY